jgi:hypothetical protein
MPPRHRCPESEEFAGAVGASAGHYIYRDLGVFIRTAGRPAATNASGKAARCLMIIIFWCCRG